MNNCGKPKGKGVFNPKKAGSQFYANFTATEVNQEYLDKLYKIATENDSPNSQCLKNGSDDRKREKRRRSAGKRLSKLASVAVICIVSITAITAVTLYTNPQTVSGVKDMLARNIFHTQDEKLVTGADNGIGKSTEIEKTLSMVTWEEVLMQKEAFPKLGIPQYLPAGYTFKKLDVNTYADGMYVVEYIFENSSGDNLLIKQHSVSQKANEGVAITCYDEIVEMNGFDVYLSKADVEKKIAATYYLGYNKVSISGKLEEVELEEIIKNYTI